MVGERVKALKRVINPRSRGISSSMMPNERLDYAENLLQQMALDLQRSIREANEMRGVVHKYIAEERVKNSLEAPDHGTRL